MAKRSKEYRPKSFEAIGSKFTGIHGSVTADTSACIFESMLQSSAFKALTSKQKVLYLYLKAQYYGKRKPEKDFPDVPQVAGADKFYFNWDLAQCYGLYKSTCRKNFSDDMSALMDHGFIELVSCGKSHRQKNIYRYSDKWQQTI